MRTKLKRIHKKPACESCGQPIPRSEPDITLEHLEAPGKRYFHERCALDACRAVVKGKPGVWQLTHRHVDAEAN
jgi:hypothetical protein